MGFRFFGTHASPIAIDFGTSSVKLLQTGLGDRPNLIAAAELPMPSNLDPRSEEALDYLGSELPRLLRKGGFKGKRVIFSMPGQQTMIHHLQLGPADGMKRDDAVKSQLQVQMNISPRNTVVRSTNVTELHRDGQVKTEVICFAIPRDAVMRYVAMLEKCRLQVVGVQTEVQSMVRAFDHIHRRKSDENITTMYVDLGWSNTRVAIAHGKSLTFARAMQIGGQTFDQTVARQLGCDLESAKAHRLAMRSPSPAAAQSTQSSADAPQRAGGTANNAGGDEGGMARLSAAMAKGRTDSDSDEPQRSHQSEAARQAAAEEERRIGRHPSVLPQPVDPEPEPSPDSASPSHQIDLSESLDTITDELSMCVRYHRGLFPDRQIDRVILLGGEARQPWLCRHIVRSLRVPARLGDPLARFTRDDQTVESIGLSENQAQPGWAVASGLCSSPADW